MSSMEINNIESYGHEYLHTAIPLLIEEGNLMQFSALLKPALAIKECHICANLLVDNYPAIDLWMHWTGFNEFECWAFYKATELLDPIVILNKSVNNMQWPLIYRAISNNHVEFVKHLVNVSPIFLSQKCENDSVLQFALKLGRSEIVRYFIELIDANPVAAQYIQAGTSDFVVVSSSSICGLQIIYKFLNILIKKKEEGWIVSLYRGFQVMAFKRPNVLKDVLTYFLANYPDEVHILYEPIVSSDSILFALAHEHMTSAVIDILKIEPKAANIKSVKTGKTLLMRAIELDNIQLTKKLLEEYGVDMKITDKLGNNIFTHACIHGNLNIMEYLLKKGVEPLIKIQTFLNEEMRTIPCDNLMEFSTRAAYGDLDLNIFTEMIRSLYMTFPDSYWPWVSSDSLRNFLFPEQVPGKTIIEVKNGFDKVYKVLHQYKITLRCSNVFDIIMLDTTISYEKKEIAVKSGILQTQMSLMIREPNLEYPCSEMYETKEFALIKEYINIEDFNEICTGREIASLKRFCRSVIREQIFHRKFIKKLNESRENAQSLIEGAFNSLQLPNETIRYIRYLY